MNESSLKIVLLVLSGDAKTARDWLKQNYASASLEIVSRYQLEKHSALGRVRAARQLRADIFVIATERLAWQRGQNAMLAFGALAGARQVVLIDSYGGVRKESGRAAGCEAVEELTLEAPLVLPSAATVRLQVAVGGADHDGRRPVQVHAQVTGPWTRHARGWRRDTHQRLHKRGQRVGRADQCD